MGFFEQRRFFTSRVGTLKLFEAVKHRNEIITYIFFLSTLVWCWRLFRSSISEPDVGLSYFAKSYREAARGNLTIWRDELFVRSILLQTSVEWSNKSRKQPTGHSRFDAFNPIVTCPKGEKIEKFGGEGDGGKFLCPSILDVPNCVVLSFGSNLDYRFEMDILQRTECTVITFDCTVNGNSVHPRHTFVKKCLGTRDQMRENPKDWISVSQSVANLRLGRITYMKFDIEGSEYDVLGTTSIKDKQFLPMMISMELHYNNIYSGTSAYENPNAKNTLFWPCHGDLSVTELSLFMAHVAQLGYAVVSRDDNPNCPHCSELTLLRVA